MFVTGLRPGREGSSAVNKSVLEVLPSKLRSGLQVAREYVEIVNDRVAQDPSIGLNGTPVNRFHRVDRGAEPLAAATITNSITWLPMPQIGLYGRRTP